MAKHRAGRRAHSGASATSGAATGTAAPGRHASIRGAADPVRRLRSAPVLVLAAALVVAAAGAASVAQQALASGNAPVTTRIGAATVSSTGPASSVLADRQSALSRDSSRTALLDAVDKRRQAAAQAAEAKAEADRRDTAQAKRAGRAKRHAARVARTAWRLPIRRGRYQLTARFGESSALWAHRHTGLDFAGAVGTAVTSVTTGKVTAVGYSGAYGLRTVIRLADRTRLWYCHQSRVVVARGQAVSPGQLIGYLGASGNVTGPHLHLEVRPPGVGPVDPYAALVRHGLRP